MKRVLRIFGWTSTFLFLVFIVLGFSTPFEDKQGKCTICGMSIFEKSSERLSSPIRAIDATTLSKFYYGQGLPDHQHNWEFLGGVTRTNLFSFPAEYEFERSDSLLLVPEDFMIQVLTRLEEKDAQIELLRALNCDIESVKKLVRRELQSRSPGGMGGFLAWWEEFAMSRMGEFPSEMLPGPPWKKRMTEVGGVEEDVQGSDVESPGIHDPQDGQAVNDS